MKSAKSAPNKTRLPAHVRAIASGTGTIADYLTPDQMAGFLQWWQGLDKQLRVTRDTLRARGVGKYSDCTVYEVPGAVVRKHNRSGFLAVRFRTTPRGGA